MLPRVLEPEVMDTQAEALDYDSMDHSEVNRLFVDDFLMALESRQALRSALAGHGRDGSAIREKLDDESNPLEVLDAGTGTALIPIELCRRALCCHLTAIDLADEMLKLAERNVAAAGLTGRITLQRVDSKRLPYAAASFEAVISNSIVHHIPEPVTVLAEMLRVLRPGGVLFVRDLLRPHDPDTLDRLVCTHAGDANTHQQQMFRDSLHAALTLGEVRQLLVELNVPAEWVRQTTDRHWTIIGG